MSEQARPSLIRSLKRLLPSASWPWLFPALRLDPLIWNSLNHFEQVFGVRDLSEIIQHPEDCSPAALGLRALKYPRAPQELRTLPLIPVETTFREQVEAAENIPITSLKDAALLALNLRQKRQATGSWNDWASYMEDIPTTPLACLFGMIPDQLEYLQALLPSHAENNGQDEAYQRLLTVILSNPAPFSVHIELITLLLHSLSPSEQDLLRQALSALQPALVSKIPELKSQRTQSPLEKGEQTSGAEGVIQQLKSFTKQLPRSVKIFDRRQPDLKSQQLAQSIQWTAQTQALMLAKLAILCELNGNESDSRAHWQDAVRLQPHSESLKALALLSSIAKSSTSYPSKEEFARNTPETALLQFVDRLLEEQQDAPTPSPTRENLIILAQAAIEEIEIAAGSDPFLNDPEIHDYLSVLLISHLIEKGFFPLAQRILTRLLKNKPNHLAWLSLSALLLHVQGLHDQALEIWHLLEGLHPHDERLSTLLAQSHAINGDWQAALQLWKNLPSLSSQTVYETITCARFAGQESSAIEQCIANLSATPQDGILLSLLAEIDSHQVLAQRLELHQQATELAPSEPYIWLAYARTAHENQNSEKALSILKAAEQTLPNNPFIQYALGKYYLTAAQPSLALPSLQAAAETVTRYQPFSLTFSPHQLLADDDAIPDFIQGLTLRFNPDWGSRAMTYDQWYGNLIADLSEALFQLGHRKEAWQVLESAYEKYSAHVGLAHQFARLNMAEGNYENAGKLLKEVVLQKSDDLQAAIDFARCAMKVPSLASVDEIIGHLQSVLEAQPEHFEALTLLAQALSRNEQPQAALQLYDQILRLPQAHEPAVKEQLAFEMSQAALKANEYELALTTLLECDPQNPLIQRTLAETYTLLGLHQEAVRAAQTARSLASSDLPTLIWYANLLTRIAHSDPPHALELQSDAIEALKQAVELAPQRHDLLLTLAETLYDSGDPQQAKEILLRFVPENGAETEVSETELIKAAQYLSLLGEQDAALACYEQSVTLLQAASPPDEEKICEILQTIAAIYRQKQRYPELERTLLKATTLRPDHLSLFLDYLAAWLEVNHLPFNFSDGDETLHTILGRLEYHLEQNPDEKPLALLYGLVLRWLGNSSKAVEILTQLLSDLRNSAAPISLGLLVTTLTELSRIHRSRGEQQLAEYWLDEGIKWHERNFGIIQPESCELYCDWLAAAVYRGEDCQQRLMEIYNNNPNHLRLIALMSYLKINQADFRGAKMLFETALGAIAERTLSPTGFHPAIVKLLDASQQLETLYTFATVAQRLGEWNLACEFFNQALRLDPERTCTHWGRLRSLVLRAEYQHLCKRLGILTNAAGEAAFTEEAKRDFAESAEFLRHHSCPKSQETLENGDSINEWIWRGKIVFGIAEEDQVEISGGQISGEILGTMLLVASQAHLQKLLATAQSYQTDPLVMFLSAVLMLDFQPQKAITLLENLLKQLEYTPEKFSIQQGWLLSPKHFSALIGVAYAQAILNGTSSSDEETTTKRTAALQALDAALELYPDEPNWHRLAAQLASLDSSSQENLQKAIAHLEQAIRLNGQDLELHLKLAQLYLELQKIDMAIQTLENAAHLAENDSRVDYWFAQAYLKKHQLELAAQSAQTAIEKNPFDLDALLLRGEIALQMQDAATALQLAEQALEQPIENPLIWALFARALHAAGKTDDALRVLDQTIPQKIDYLDLHLQKIAILRQWRGAEAALQEINALLEIFPQAIPLSLCRAELLAELGEIDLAISAAQTALRQAHQNPSTARLEDHAQGHRLIGELFYRNGHLDQAVYHLSEAIRLLPNDDVACLTLGDVYLSRGENERALAAYQQCLKLNPENSSAYFKSGVLYKEFKDYPAAEQMLRQAARLEPNNLAIQRQLGAVVALNLIHTRRTKEKNTP